MITVIHRNRNLDDGFSSEPGFGGKISASVIFTMIQINKISMIQTSKGNQTIKLN